MFPDKVTCRSCSTSLLALTYSTPCALLLLPSFVQGVCFIQKVGGGEESITVQRAGQFLSSFVIINRLC